MARRRYTITVVRNGHRYRRSVRASSRAEAVRFLRNRMIARGRRGFHFDKPNTCSQCGSRRRKKNPSLASKIAWTLGITAATAAVGAIVVYYVNKKLPKEEAPKPALNVSVTGEWADKLTQLFAPVKVAS